MAAIRERADAQALQLQPVLEEELRAEGITTLAGFVEAFNERGMQTPRGGQWHASSVRNLLVSRALSRSAKSQGAK